MRRYLMLTALLAIAAGCKQNPFGNDPNGNDPGTDSPVTSGRGALKQFANEAEFSTYFSDQVMGQNDQFADLAANPPMAEVDNDNAPGRGESLAPAAPSADGAGDAGITATDGGNFSGTTTQETGVDEADVVKTDGTNLYVIDGSRLHIVKAGLGDLAETGSVALEGYGQDIDLRGTTIVAVTSYYGGFIYADGGFGGGGILTLEAGVAEGDVVDGSAGGVADDAVEPTSVRLFAAPFQYERPKTIITVIDASDATNPTIVSTTKFEGSHTASRMIDGMLHLVLANYPDYYFDVMPMLGRPEMSFDTVRPAADLLPDFERTDAAGNVTSGDLLTVENVYHPADPDGFGMVSVVSVDVDNDAVFKAVGIVAQPSMIYSSTEALYLTNANYDPFGEAREATTIFKLAYTADGATPTAAGSVPGRVLNQYSMGEHNGYLRVATTTGFNFFFDGTNNESTNAVYVLGQEEDVLKVVGSVEGIAPRESVQSVRFLGDKGFVVTFEQTDPLFTLDLSDPTAPKVVGELEVPGFSTFITPIDDNHLLTVGQYVDPEGLSWVSAVQMSIFDVTDFAHPVRTHNRVVGAESGSWSEALWNPKAFTYFAESGMVALPVSIYGTYTYEDTGPGIDDLAGILDDLQGDGSAGSDGLGGVAEEVAALIEEIVDLLNGDDEGVASSGAGTSSAGEGGEVVDGGGEAPPADEDMVIDVIDALPIDYYVPQYPADSFDGLMVFSVSATGGFDEVARISTRPDEMSLYGYYYWPSFTRGVFIGATIYAVTDIGIQAAALADVAGTLTKIDFERPDLFPPLPGEEPTDPTTIAPGEPNPTDPTTGETPAIEEPKPEAGSEPGSVLDPAKDPADGK